MRLLFRRSIVISLVIFWIFASLALASSLSRQITYKHGVSENGELQVYRITQIMKDGEEISREKSLPYSPESLSNMEGFDPRSIEISSVLTSKVMDDLALEQKQPLGVGLEEIVRYDRMVDDLGRISVRMVTRIYDNGNVISKKYLRSWLMPGQDYSKSDVISKALAEKLHTPTVIKRYKDKMKELSEKK